MSKLSPFFAINGGFFRLLDMRICRAINTIVGMKPANSMTILKQEKQMKEKNDEHPFGDKGQLIFLAVFLLVWILDSFIFKISTFLASSIPLFIRLAVLALCLTLGILLSKSGHRAAEDNYRGKGVIKTEAFQFVRHPLYLASMVTYFGVAVSTLSLLSLALLIPIIFFFDSIASYEEKYMENKFGKEYLDYKQKTGKWIPGTN